LKLSKVVLSGYYGFNNAGDELVLYSIIRTLREIEPGISITVLSQQPEKTAKQYEVQAVNRWRLFSLIRSIASSELLISGGGSLFQDVTSVNSPLYYWMIIFLAKLMGKKTMIYSQGVGPLQRPRNRKMLAWLFNRLSKITVRDEGAKSDLLAMGVNKEIIVTADPVLGIPPQSIEAQLGREILERSGLELIVEQRLLGVFIRSWEDNSYLPELVKACDRLALEGWQVVFVPMQFPQDIAVAKQAAKLMAHETVYLKEMYDPAEMLAITKNFDLIIGMRLHSLINGAVVGVPLVGISYDPKIDRFLQQIGQQSLNSVHDLNSETLVQLVNWVHNNREEIQADMEKRVKLLYQKAWKSARIAMELWRN
jgi:polysaccharide pyruvyl transferase CsaB